MKQEVRCPWAVESASLARALSVDLNCGLTGDEAARRLAAYGPNRLRAEPPIRHLALLLEQFESPVVLTLLAATVLSGALGDTVDAIAIAMILLINAAIGYEQKVRAERAVTALKKLSTPKTRLLREGRVRTLLSEDVVPGDVLVLEAGDFVPADGRLLVAHGLSVQEAALTGESLPSEKATAPVAESSVLPERSNMIFAGTTVQTGSARALVTATAMKTEIGRVAELLETSESGPTPLQVRLSAVGNRLLLFCSGVVAFVALLGWVHGESWLSVVMSAVSLGVAAIPEGLPTVVTLALALAVRRMVKRNAIVRELSAVETLGSTDVICTDKTGTLTTGEMAVREIVLEGRVLSVAATMAPAAKDLARSAARCNNADIGQGTQSSGDPTEVALLRMARELGVEPATVRRESPRAKEWPFDSDRKRMAVATPNGTGWCVDVKGAPESVLPLCHLAPQERERLHAVLLELSAQGRRVLAIARRSIEKPPTQLTADDVEKELDFLGLVAMADPPRDEVARAVAQCRSAGITVVMITGDHPVTAAAIARELGILADEAPGSVVTGQEMETLTDEELLRGVERVKVYARVSPEHKLRIVRAWKRLGRVVAMTGDGVNDGPALREATVGVAMGRGGTEVARQASSLVLVDDNFATIVAAVAEGRAVHGNIERAIRFLLVGNVAEISIMLGAAIVALPAPFLPIHLLWINLVTDGLPTLALAAEPVRHEAIGESRRSDSRSFSSWAFYRSLLLPGAAIAGIALGVFQYGIVHGTEVLARTYVFTFFVLEELFRSFASRSRRHVFFGLRTNPVHLIAVGIPIAMQLAILGWSPLREIFRVSPLHATEWLALTALALVPVTLIEVRKLFRARKRGTVPRESATAPWHRGA